MHPYLPFTALPAAVLVAWFGASNWADGEPGRYRVPSVAPIENPTVPAQALSQSIEKPDIRVEAFLPHVPPKRSAIAPTLILHSVMFGTDVNLATINGRMVQEGDTIEGYLVKRITADGVVLTGRGKTRRLPMRPLHELPPPRQAASGHRQGSAAVAYDGPHLANNIRTTITSSQP